MLDHTPISWKYITDWKSWSAWMVGSYRGWAITASCEQEWWPVICVIFVRFCHVVRILACRNWREMWWSFSSLLSETYRITCTVQPIEQKTHFIFVGIHKQVLGNQYGGYGLSCLHICNTHCIFMSQLCASSILSWRGFTDHSMHISI